MRLTLERGGAKRRVSRLMAMTLTAAAALTRQGGAGVVTAPTLADADKHWTQRSYARALTEYETLQKNGQVPAARQDEVAYRVAVLPGKTERWDRALAAGVEFVRARRGTVWEARGVYWLGRLYLSVPHQGYRVGARTFRGENVPKAEGDEKPVYVDATARDQRNALDALEAAHILYARRVSEMAATARQAASQEQAQLDFDLIHLLQQDPNFPAWAQAQAWLPPNDPTWQVDASKPYDPAWPQPKKIAYLFQLLIQTDPPPHGAAHPTSALALWGEALWLRRYQALMRGWTMKFENGKSIPVPFPYQGRQPADSLTRLIRLHRGDSLSEQARMLGAAWQAQDGDLAGSLQAYRRFVADCPRSRWVGDARAEINALLRSSVSVASLSAARPGLPPKLQITSRNADRVHFEAYRIDLPRLLARGGDTKNNREWGQLSGLIGSDTLRVRRRARMFASSLPARRQAEYVMPSLPARLAALGARRVAAWDVMTNRSATRTADHRGDLKPRSQNITAPFKAAGAYVVVASVPGQRYGLLVPISDLVLAQKRERGSSLFYVADAETGRPQPGVRIVTKLLWHKSRESEGGKSPVETWGARVTDGHTGSDGVVTIPIRRKTDEDETRLGAIAWTGNRFALIGPEYVSQYDDEYGNASSSGIQVKGYLATDRAVYRPRQVVQFRQLVMRQGPEQNGRQGGMRPLVNRAVRVEVSDPQGNSIYKQRAVCSAWGSVSGRFTLPDHAPLGEYSIEVTLPEQGTRKQGTEDTDAPDTPISNAGSQFRVEEYKKPEYEVTVTPGAERVRLGQTGRVKIHAAYYFGGPVPGASVAYRVYRNVYAAVYRFPEPYDYLYHADDNRGSYDTDYRSGEVMAQGRARLDAQGDAFVTFSTSASGPRWDNNDLSFTVEADVQDQTRRVISGTGALKATKHDVAVFLHYAHGYATQGDQVAVEVKTLNPSDQPVSAAGMARVYRQSTNPADTAAEAPAGGIRKGETLAWSGPLHTDAQGYAQIAWKANTSGYFRIAFETRDADSIAGANAGGANASNTVNAPNALKTPGTLNASLTSAAGDSLVSGDTFVYVDGPELRSRRYLFGGVALAVKNPYYQAGQTANVLLVTPEPGCTVLLTREAEGRILNRRVVQVPGRSLEIPVAVTGRDVPNVFLSALMIRRGEMFEATQELFVPPAQQTARVTVTPDKARYAPGERARLQILARDWRGRPLHAELSVAITDAALNYIQKDYAPDIRAYFYGDRRQQNIENAASPQTDFQPVSQDIGVVPNYLPHPLTMPLDMGQIPAAQMPGSYYGLEADGLVSDQNGSLFFGSNGGNQFRSYDKSDIIANSGSNRIVGGHFGAGMPARVAAYGRYLGSANMAAADGNVQYFSRPAGPRHRPASLQAATEKGAASAQSVPMPSIGAGGTGGLTGKRDASRTDWHIADASGLKRKQVYAPGQLADATIRSDFRDTAFWTPSVVTDAQGRANVTVTWPDNLTQWRANAVASTQAAQVGVGTARITTKKDLLVQFASPRFVVERDVVTLSAVVHNDTSQAQRVRVRLDLDNADVVAEDVAQEEKGERGKEKGVPGIPSVQTVSNKQQATGNLAASNLATSNLAASNNGEQRLRVRTSETWVMIAPRGQQRVDWLARPQREGVMHARMTAQSQTDGDAAQIVIPVLVHGVERTVVQSGMLKGADRAALTITLPAQRKAGSSQLVVTLNPSLAGVMLDALPYLNEYPYGCVEQTLSRFVPSVLVARSLRAAGYDMADLERAAQRHGSLNAQTEKERQTPDQANSAYTYPNAPTGAQHQEISATGERWRNPVFSPSELNKMTRDGLARLKAMQRPDGGWGWYSDDSSDTYMTAQTLYGLLQAQGAGVTVDGDELANGLKYLRARYLAETDREQMAFEARVLALAPGERAAIRNRVDNRLFVQRDRLGAYGKALLALALHDLGENAQARVVLDNLENTAHIDEASGTATWDDINAQWWRWYNNKIETNAAILQAYTAIEPNAKLPALLVRWLVNNRRGASWRDTRDTALTVAALSEWARVHKEFSPDYTLSVDLGGRIRRVYHITHQNALFGDNTFVVPDALLQTGEQTLTITRQGTGTCYYAATTRTFSQEEPIAATGNEIRVTRRYFRLIPGTAQGTAPQTFGGYNIKGDDGTLLNVPVASSLLSAVNPFLSRHYELLEQGGEEARSEDTDQGPHYDRVELKPGEMLNSGDLLEVELGLEAQNDYEYVLFEDMKPAGCEPVELRSGSHTGQGVYANRELRDDKVVFFLTSLPQGRRILSYRLRAETPGVFHVLPTNGYAMYAPDVRALSDEARIGIRDVEPGETVKTSTQD